jgi:Uncharacterized protein conserved in bacteria
MAKKAFVLRIEESTLKAVEKWAADEFRSTNGQLEWMIDKALKEVGRSRIPTTESSDNNENKKVE